MADKPESRFSNLCVVMVAAGVSPNRLRSKAIVYLLADLLRIITNAGKRTVSSLDHRPVLA